MVTKPGFDFSDLFVLDMANNHQGCVNHGKAIVAQHGEVVRKHNVRAGIKFQFRDLPNFVHISERQNPTNKHVPRFLSTVLDWEHFNELVETVRAEGMLTICTPFDEASVDKIKEMGFDVIKVASCSARDWPLLEAVAASGLPVIASTGGLAQSEVDDLVSFLSHRACEFALMHCVSIYPTPDAACNLSNIATFRARYPRLTIGWSTHEPPSDTTHVGLAAALGARMFERHIGVETETIKLNQYSSTPAETDAWIAAFRKANRILGAVTRDNILPEEKAAIDGLKRGVFAKADIPANHKLTAKDIYYAFPFQAGQISSSEFREGSMSTVAISKDDALRPENCEIFEHPDHKAEQTLKKSIHEVKAMLALAGVKLNHEFQTEYSHHYGMENFREVGAVLITVVNREYAKKILVQLPGQRHPLHMHKLKEETFLVVYGELVIELDGDERILRPGDQLTVPPGVWHCFHTNTGVVFEEISTTAFPSDSYYRDNNIAQLSSAQRKTVVDHWGRFQINAQLRKSNITG